MIGKAGNESNDAVLTGLIALGISEDMRDFITDIPPSVAWDRLDALRELGAIADAAYGYDMDEAEITS